MYQIFSIFIFELWSHFLLGYIMSFCSGSTGKKFLYWYFYPEIQEKSFYFISLDVAFFLFITIYTGIYMYTLKIMCIYTFFCIYIYIYIYIWNVKLNSIIEFSYADNWTNKFFIKFQRIYLIYMYRYYLPLKMNKTYLFFQAQWMEYLKISGCIQLPN